MRKTDSKTLTVNDSTNNTNNPGGGSTDETIKPPSTDVESTDGTILSSADSETDKKCCSRASRCCCCLANVNVTNNCCWFITWRSVFDFITNLSTVLLSWSVIYFLTGDAALPGGAIFGFALLIACSYCLGWSLTWIPYLHLPPVFGMLIAGVIARNTGLYNIRETMDSRSMGMIRNFCLTFVMVRSGIQLNTTPLRTHPVNLMVLALIPCTVETIVVTFCFKGFLGFPWDWAFLGGSVIACMSPVVTVNCLLALADRGYGEDKEISGLLCAACSIDGVHIVAIFSIAFSIVFDDNESSQKWWSYLPRGIRDMSFGVICGITLGLFFAFFPHQSYKYATTYRITNLSLGALFLSLGAGKFFITGGGFLATVLMSFISCTGWKIIVNKFDVKPIRKVTAIIWHILQPVLCGVIGADVDFSHWTITRTGLYTICILTGLFTRFGCAVLSTIKLPFTMSERIFVGISWLPKGTVQAALAPMAYENAIGKNDTVEIGLAEDVVKVSVMAIIFLAPFGALIMMLTGPRLLNRISNEAIIERRLQSLRMLGTKTPDNKNNHV